MKIKKAIVIAGILTSLSFAAMGLGKNILKPEVKLIGENHAEVTDCLTYFKHSQIGDFKIDELTKGRISNWVIYQSAGDESNPQVKEITELKNGVYLRLTRYEDYERCPLKFEEGDFLMTKARKDYTPLIDEKRKGI